MGLLICTFAAIPIGVWPKPAVSLSCLFTPFLSNLDPSQPLILGEIQSFETDGSIFVSVKETLVGDVNKALIHVDSRSYTYWSGGKSAFPEKSTWVFKLHRSHQDGFDFSISPCINPPKIEGRTVSGLLLKQQNETMTLNEFKKKVTENIQ